MKMPHVVDATTLHKTKRAVAAAAIVVVVVGSTSVTVSASAKPSTAKMRHDCCVW